MKLKHKILTVFSLIALLPLIVVTAVYVSSSRTTLVEIIADQLRVNLREFSVQVNDRTGHFKNDLLLLSGLGCFRDGQPRSGDAWISELNSSIGAYYIKNEAYIASVTIVDTRVSEQYTVDRLVYSDEGVTPYIRVESCDSGVPRFDAGDVRTEYLNEGTGGFFVQMTAPLSSDTGVAWGFIRMRIRLTRIMQDISGKHVSQYEQRYFARDDRGAEFFAAAGRDGSVRLEPGITYPEVAGAALTGNGAEVTVDGLRWFAAGLDDERSGISYTGMLLIEPYIQRIYKESALYFGITLLLVVVLSGAIRHYSVRLSSRIESVKTAAARIAEGKLDTRIETNIDDEIGHLSQAVNLMAGDLQRYIDNIREMSREVAEKEKLDELNELKSRFISMTSHELKTPLTTIKWTLDNMLKGVYGGLSDDQRDNLRSLEGTADHLVRTVEALLDLSRIESGTIALDMKIHSVDALIDEAIYFTATLAGAKRITVEKELRIDQKTVVRCDRDKMVHILRNLLDNAIKFSPDDGRVTVAAYYGAEGRINISVKDRGIGISEEDRKNIFTPFYKVRKVKSRSKGLGIGLSIVKTLVEYHNSEIQVQSEPGEGTEFTLSIPPAEVESK